MIDIFLHWTILKRNRKINQFLWSVSIEHHFRTLFMIFFFSKQVDATHTANIGRFLNHSCLANCETFIAYVGTIYAPIPVIAFFTNRMIKENEELTIDYYMGAEQHDINGENFQSKTTCLCRSPFCKKYIF